MRYWDSTKPKRRAARRRSPASKKRSIAGGGSLRQYPFLRQFYQHQAVIGVGIQKFLFFLLIATLLYAFVFGDAGAIRIIALKNEKADLQEHLAMLDEDIQTLRHEIDRLENDPYIMEKLGRERYGYVYPGDRVYKIITPHRRR